MDLLATDHVAVVDGAADQRTTAGAKDRTERFPAARSDDRPEHRAGHAADNQARGAVIAAAVVMVVGSAVDAIGPVQPPRRITAIVAVVACRIPVLTLRGV